jgi:hypothetical protein
MSVFRKPKFLLSLSLAALVALLLFPQIKNVLDVAAVQAAVQRDWEIAFYDSAGPRAVPAMLPDRLNKMACDLAERLYGETSGYDGSQPAKTRNRDSVMIDRFYAFFRGPIEEIGVSYFEKFHGDLGAALARFPVLRRVTVF